MLLALIYTWGNGFERLYLSVCCKRAIDELLRCRLSCIIGNMGAERVGFGNVIFGAPAGRDLSLDLQELSNWPYCLQQYPVRSRQGARRGTMRLVEERIGECGPSGAALHKAGACWVKKKSWDHIGPAGGIAAHLLQLYSEALLVDIERR